ncbi:unnamed protein product [Rhizoctonia solani]|nr:unnamed protein product [Rhizoctonia solani]
MPSDDDSDEVPLRTTWSDVWAFGCVALEVQMDLNPWDPFDTHNPNAMVNRQYNAGAGHPATVADPNLNLEAHPIKQQVWDLMVQCWDADPQSRPTAAKLLEEILGMNLEAT